MKTTAEYVAMFKVNARNRGDTQGAFIGADEAAMAEVVNEVLEAAAVVCENSQSGHRNDGPDAARRNCAMRIRALKLKVVEPKGLS